MVVPPENQVRDAGALFWPLVTPCRDPGLRQRREAELVRGIDEILAAPTSFPGRCHKGVSPTDAHPPDLSKEAADAA